jgi:glycylpeptide N-tetradecanoyltransferase
MLIMAKRLDFDVFNALDAMHNPEMFKELRFGIGDGNLQFYLYNWSCEQMQSGRVGLILV